MTKSQNPPSHLNIWKIKFSTFFFSLYLSLTLPPHLNSTPIWCSFSLEVISLFFFLVFISLDFRFQHFNSKHKVDFISSENVSPNPPQKIQKEICSFPVLVLLENFILYLLWKTCHVGSSFIVFKNCDHTHGHQSPPLFSGSG